MSACGSCSKWDRAEKFETGHSLGYGRCRGVPMFWDATEWDEYGLERTLRPEHKETKAFVQDGSDYKAVLITRPDFGCVAYDAQK